MATHPKLNLATVMRTRDRLLANALQLHLTPGQPVGGEQLTAITNALLRELPKTVSYDAVFESVRYLAGRELTAGEAATLAWRLAGNMRTLKQQQPVRPWVPQAVEEYLPLQVLRATPARNERNKVGHRLELRVLSGTPCPMKLHVFWTTAQLSWLARRIGFSASWDKYPYHKGVELVGLRLLARTDPDRSQYAPFIYACEKQPGSLITWNRKEVLRYRMRIEPCPNNFAHACRNCAVGYEDCRAGVHRKTYELGNCPVCGQPEAPFDPESHSPHCVTCTIKENLSRV